MLRFALVAACFFSVSPADPPFAAGGKEIYYSFDLPEAASGDTLFWESLKWGLDSPIPVLRVDGHQHYFASAFNRVWKFQEAGDTDDVMGMKVATSTHNYDFYRNAAHVPIMDSGLIHNNKVYKYIMNIYKAGTGDLYGLLHIEDLRGCACPAENPVACDFVRPFHTPVAHCTETKYRIGLARCASAKAPCEGGGWEFLGVIAGTHFDSLHFDGSGNLDFLTNIGGAPFMVKDGYLYVYFSEWLRPGEYAEGQPYHGQPAQRLSAVRARLKDVLDQAKKDVAGGPHSPWSKFNGYGIGSCSSKAPLASNCWTLDPIHGTGGTILPYGDAHTDMTYSTKTGKYYMPLVRYPTDDLEFPAILLYSSANGIDWAEPVSIDDSRKKLSYPSIIPLTSDSTSDDGSRVGSQFYIVYTGRDVLSPTPDGHGRIPVKIFRYKISL